MTCKTGRWIVSNDLKLTFVDVFVDLTNARE